MAENITLMLDDGIPGMSGNVSVGLGDVDVDDVDLFGGSVDLGLPSHPPPPSKQLQLRVDEQRTRGCCQRIGWSKQGTIATISDDGKSIQLRYLRADPDSGAWGLSDPTAYAQFSHVSMPTTFSGGPIVHLAWAATGHPELAVIDSVGRISILTFSTSLNRPVTLRSWEADPIDDLNAVVGCYWLPIMPANKQYNFLHGPAIREDQAYRYETSFIHAFGPHHPNPAKSALLCVTSSARLRLFFSQNSSVVHDTSIELENIASSDDLTTHASICSEKGVLLIAMTTASRQLKVVRAAIHWNLPQQQDKPTPPPFNPIMQHKHAASTTWLQHGDSESQLDISSAQISHVEMLPSALPGPNQASSPPLVVTVRNYLPGILGGSGGPNAEPQSIINRWELLMEPAPPPLHPAFEQLGFRPTTNSSSQGPIRLNRLPPIVLRNKTVVSVQSVQNGKALCFLFSDGTLQYRDRFTFDEIFHEPDLARISSLQHAGFEFVDPTPCLAAALSPTNCSSVQLCQGGSVKWNTLRYTGPAFAASGPDPNRAAVIAGITTAVATANSNQISYDDILATAREFADGPKFAYDWVLDIVRVLKINVDYAEESHHDQLVRNNALHLCLSVLNHMGFRGEFKKRTFSSKFSMLALNIRNIVILITLASNTPGTIKEKLNPLDEPDVVDALSGCAKWSLDLLSYICDSLFNLLADPKFMSFLAAGGSFGDMVGYLQEKNEVALHLILCSSTRGFLSAVCRRLQHMDSISARATQFYEHQQQAAAQQGAGFGAYNSSQRPPLIVSYQKMQQYTSSSLVKVQEFDKLLWALGGEIRQLYQARQRMVQQAAQQQGQTPQQQKQQVDAARHAQAQSEQALLLGHTPQPPFQALLYKFFDENVRAFRGLTDPAKLYFADYSVLEVEDDERSLLDKRTKRLQIDVFKRVELAPARPWDGASRGPAGSTNNTNNTGGYSYSQGPPMLRRCVRCAAVMDDIGPGPRPGYQFVLAQQRKCSCSGNWGLVPRV